MAAHRQEDLRVKIPALIHLTRLGYRYLPLSAERRNPDTNILPDVFHRALEKINGCSVPEQDCMLLMEELRAALEREALGEAFFSRLHSAWRGLKLVDYSVPENNLFHVMTELPCNGEAGRFRPDITLLVNGMPLAFIEVKNPHPGGSVRSEFDRMDRRARNPGLRRFINETQIMVFSNDMEEKDPLVPLRGAFYATTAYDRFVFHAAEEWEIPGELPRTDPGEVRRILEDNRLDPSFGEDVDLSPDTPTHRLLTSLFHVRHLLFFLRCGIFYLQEPGEAEPDRVTKQIVRFSQLRTARLLERSLSPEPEGGRVWQVHAGGKAALTGIQLRFLGDYFARRNRPVRFFYLVDSPDRARGIARELQSRGFPVRDYSPLSAVTLREEAWRKPSDPLVEIVPAFAFRSRPLPPAMTDKVPYRRVYFLDELGDGYEAGPSLLSRLRDADPDALMIAYAWDPAAEMPLHPAPLLLGSRIP